jgi:hypothetical protein
MGFGCMITLGLKERRQVGLIPPVAGKWLERKGFHTWRDLWDKDAGMQASGYLGELLINLKGLRLWTDLVIALCRMILADNLFKLNLDAYGSLWKEWKWTYGKPFMDY